MIHYRNEIIKRLQSIEKEFSVAILLAVESGSRAWGFESTDSDFDVRFIYAHPENWYVNVLPKRDVIEMPISDDYDFSGWDIKKALFLMSKSNPVLFEWLISPIIYKKDAAAYDAIRQCSERFFSPKTAIHHYLHMAEGNFREYLQGELVRVKKYFYVLRPLFACMWIEKYGSYPPMLFQELVEAVSLDTVLVNEIEMLLSRKKSGVELGLEKRIDVINDFLDEKITYYNAFASHVTHEMKGSASDLDNTFQKIIRR
ncbi:MAG: nucleotidyltransferase domain-containing protein [Spirochaetota bacterium]